MGAVYKIDQAAPDAATLARAVGCLVSGGVAVIPTDSVYGLACAATEHNPGHERIFRIKNRPRTQTLPLLIADPADLERYATHVSAGTRALAKKFWPGALTLVVEASGALPPEYVAADGTVALRCPDSNFVRLLIDSLGCPLACTSANTHGVSAPVSFDTVESAIISETTMSLDAGAAPVATASTIVDCTKDAFRILRNGAIDEKRLEDVWSSR